MSLAAAAFVPTRAPSLPIQFEGAEIFTPKMPLPAMPPQTSAKPSMVPSKAAAENPFQKLNISAKTFVPAGVNVGAAMQ